MFTGIIESRGTLVELTPAGRLTIEASFQGLDQDPIALGESVAINGACLTVVQIIKDAKNKDRVQLSFDLAPETIQRTALVKNFSSDRKQEKVRRFNLERALKMGGRLSGHWVQGHVDGVATLIHSQPVGKDCYELIIELSDPSILRYCTLKGSITIDGVSLTIHQIKQNQLSFQIIPHTWSETNLSDLLVGDQVNFEVDCLAKYVENFLKDRH